jgi:hypothetical protein
MARRGRSSIWACFTQERGRRLLADPLAFHEDATGLFDAGIMLHGKLQLGGEPFLLAGRGQFQGGHD